MICIGSDCHLNNGCLEPHLVASDGICCDPFKIHKTKVTALMCYQKSVSTALVQCLTRKREERSKFWKAVTQHKSIQPSEEDSCLVCQFPKQRLMLCHCFSVLLLMRRYWRCSVQLALPLAFAWFSFATGHIVSSHFRVRHWSDAEEKLFVITRNDTITCFLCWIDHNWLCGVQIYLVIIIIVD